MVLPSRASAYSAQKQRQKLATRPDGGNAQRWQLAEQGVLQPEFRVCQARAARHRHCSASAPKSQTTPGRRYPGGSLQSSVTTGFRLLGPEGAFLTGICVLGFRACRPSAGCCPDILTTPAPKTRMTPICQYRFSWAPKVLP
jgi:hypothetical protein